MRPGQEDIVCSVLIQEVRTNRFIYNPIEYYDMVTISHSVLECYDLFTCYYYNLPINNIKSLVSNKACKQTKHNRNNL